MPVGPSHSRNSGGSSSSRGGFNFSGGFSLGSIGRHRSHHRPRGPMRFNMFGHRVIISSGKQTGIFMLVGLLIFAIFACFITSNIKNSYDKSIKDSKAFISQCEIDAVWYETAKQNAEAGNNPDFFITTAIYSGYYKAFYNSNNPIGYYYDSEKEVEVNKNKFYYLIYYYEVPIDTDNDGVYDSYEIKEGETYSTFSSSQASGWDKKIIVGKDNGSWASINYDYKLSTNQEYLFEKENVLQLESSLKTINLVFAGTIIAIVLLIVIVVLVVVKVVKKGKLEYEQEQQKREAEIAESNAKAEEAERRAKQISRKCGYCGNTVPDGEDNCPSCGSSNFK